MNLENVTVTNDREGIYDAMVRMLTGIDFADEAMLRSAFAEDIVFDLSGLDPSVARLEPYRGVDVAVPALLGAVGRLDTMHAISNVRIHVEGDRAQLTCYLIGQHFRPGQGPSADFADHLWLGNRFETELVRENGFTWRVSVNRVFGVWAVGNVAATKLD